ncbi:toll/interleukin-1 receptor domain-containing protein [Aquiflexum sp. TKW24L]|uniref:toll/interleukin-1 receptor domain-containing protein n=1 Tax=Aquiflexum sp. TKW24L TaxID=2942212 RepID=UPI0020C14486|nr:toll/interleukin-1 receptor domain-containing protein [Aquiflexum sp. TKW24L]MCL6258044.1 toll/interleukin-1 receptor domain-containing protein [Aquiflexum sp. TKW24L]
MEVLEEITTARGKKLQLLKGDLTKIPESHKVDVLVLSAYPNDYIPTPSSLIGALFSAGLSVSALARDKEIDLRMQFHCWLSKEINFQNIRRVLCFEPTERWNPYSLIAGIFQSIMPFTITHSIKTVAMPLVLTGDQGYSSLEVVKELVKTCLFWLDNDSSLEVIKIVERGGFKIDLLSEAFKSQKLIYNQQIGNINKYDFFISYSRKNANHAHAIEKKLSSKFKVFFDTQSIDVGTNWLGKINTSLKSSERFIVCISPDYLDSKMCRYEYLFCNLKFINQGDDYVLPVYLYNADLPFEMQVLNFYDAREGLSHKIDDFCGKLIEKYEG